MLILLWSSPLEVVMSSLFAVFSYELISRSWSLSVRNRKVSIEHHNRVQANLKINLRSESLPQNWWWLNDGGQHTWSSYCSNVKHSSFFVRSTQSFSLGKSIACSTVHGNSLKRKQGTVNMALQAKSEGLNAYWQWVNVLTYREQTFCIKAAPL